MYIWEMYNGREGLNEFYPTKEEAEKAKRNATVPSQCTVKRITVKITRQGVCDFANYMVMK